MATSATATWWSTNAACAPCSTGSWRTWATRWKTWAGCASTPGASAALDLPVGGFGTREELFAGYVEAGGTVDAERVHYWEVFGTLKWGVICESDGAGLPQRRRAQRRARGDRPARVGGRDRPAVPAGAAAAAKVRGLMQDTPRPTTCSTPWPASCASRRCRNCRARPRFMRAWRPTRWTSCAGSWRWRRRPSAEEQRACVPVARRATAAWPS